MAAQCRLVQGAASKRGARRRGRLAAMPPWPLGPLRDTCHTQSWAAAPCSSPPESTEANPPPRLGTRASPHSPSPPRASPFLSSRSGSRVPTAREPRLISSSSRPAGAERPPLRPLRTPPRPPPRSGGNAGLRAARAPPGPALTLTALPHAGRPRPASAAGSGPRGAGSRAPGRAAGSGSRCRRALGAGHIPALQRPLVPEAALWGRGSLLPAPAPRGRPPSDVDAADRPARRPPPRVSRVPGPRGPAGRARLGARAVRLAGREEPARGPAAPRGSHPRLDSQDGGTGARIRPARTRDPAAHAAHGAPGAHAVSWPGARRPTRAPSADHARHILTPPRSGSEHRGDASGGPG
ncbi:translation initiation factor IF-2-like [Artibeus jamaicensis]|uniref:translation initiation factor IF-2-like n=1 Tax=Artibeus jamaicensis TaxID=9417 RepID=UPI00235AE03B|nr:translation initiation factor IF-2-like [Artibeus jamaicensis]